MKTPREAGKTVKQYVLALDEGTTSARAILFDREGKIVSLSQHEFPQYYPQSGWVEQDPMELYASQYAAMTECVAKSGVSPEAIAAVGITNQRETTIVWDRATGRPVYPAIVWQCRRTADECAVLEREGKSAYITEKTGLRPDAYFSATKLRWILDHVSGARERAARGELLFGTVDTWLLWKLTEGRVHATDRTNASRTMLFDIGACAWDEDLLSLFDIPRAMLPEVYPSGHVFGTVTIMGAEIPIAGIAGDQQAALFGQGCLSFGDMKCTYGTGCFLLANTGETRVVSRSGLLTTLAAAPEGAPTAYALEGSVFVGGAVVQWLRDEMGFFDESRDSEYFASKVADSAGVYVVPSFTGLGAPYWDGKATGAIVGLTRGVTRHHVIRAALEAIAYETEDVIAAMANDMGRRPNLLRVDGGASANGLLMQFQSDISNLRVLLPRTREATALGVALLAGLAVGFYRDTDDIAGVLKRDRVFSPEMKREERERRLTDWHRAVAATRAFTES